MNSKEDLLYDALEKAIFNGELAPGSKIPSEYELADTWHVNKQTANKAVSRLAAKGLVIRQKGRGGTIVARHTVADKGVIGYRLSLLSGGLFSAKLLKGAGKAAAAHGYAIRYIEWEGPEDEHWQQIARFPLSGVLSTSSAMPPPGFPFPHVSISYRYSSNYLYSDDIAGGRLAAELLLAHGHRNIALIYDYRGNAIPSRFNGFCEKMRSAGIPDPEKRIFHFTGFPAESIETLWEKVQSSFPEVTAAFCCSDNLATMLLLHLLRFKIRCPEDFSIVGYGAMPMYNNIHKITTVDQFPEELGFAACEKLIGLIEGRLREPIQQLLPVKLVNYGATAGPVPALPPGLRD